MRNKHRISWIVPSRPFFGTGMASTRLRVYDIMRYLKKRGLYTGFYNPFLHYDIVIFQKAFNHRFLKLAERLKKQGTKVVFDINVNYIDSDEEQVTTEQRRDIKTILSLSDTVITTSPYLRGLYGQYHRQVFLIEEAIEGRFLGACKRHADGFLVRLLFCGYSVKARELCLIRDVLQRLYEEKKIELILICEKNPKLQLIPYRFYTYRHKRLPELLCKGDIKISPRDMSRKYNLGHSFTRIGYPMAVGLPVIASPLAAYEGSPAILCSKPREWEEQLRRLIENPKLRQELGEAGQRFVRDHFSEEAITNKYIELFDALRDRS